MKDIRIHPVGQASPSAQVDVVFVHGLKGDWCTTWTGPGIFGYWPSWVREIPDARVWAVDYPTQRSSWRSIKLPIPSLANTIAHALVSKGLGDRPLILLGHSMGGLIIKDMLTAHRWLPDSPNAVLRNACAKVVFFSTPHDGSNFPTMLTLWTRFQFLEKLTRWTRYKIQETHLTELTRGNPYLKTLNNAFGHWLSTNRPKRAVINYCETQKLGIGPIGVLVVDKSSSDPQLDPNYVEVIDLPDDHMSICKLSQKNDLRLDAIKTSIEALKDWPVLQATEDSVLISYAWADTAAAEQSRRLDVELRSAGIPVISDLEYRDKGTAPPAGWDTWRQSSIARATKIVVIGGQHYGQRAGAQSAGYAGLILSDADIADIGLERCIPLLTEGDAETKCLPIHLRKQRYNGQRLPSATPYLIEELCSRVTPKLRDSNDD